MLSLVTAFQRERCQKFSIDPETFKTARISRDFAAVRWQAADDGFWCCYAGFACTRKAARSVAAPVGRRFSPGGVFQQGASWHSGLESFDRGSQIEACRRACAATALTPYLQECLAWTISRTCAALFRPRGASPAENRGARSGRETARFCLRPPRAASLRPGRDLPEHAAACDARQARTAAFNRKSLRRAPSSDRGE